jgi:ABC-type cobalamin/Fe3+-siderophores transport systems, ATPase components
MSAVFPAVPAEDLPLPVYEVEALDYAVPGRQLLQAINLQFRAGDITALIGHNGSGKSTLLKLLARQIRPTAGSIRYSGEAIGGMASRAFSRKVAYLSQDVSSAPGMKVRELVACGRYPWHGALGRFTDKDREKVEEALRLTHTDDLADRAVDTLSGGERQRAWIAMMVAQDTECLLLDEPTSALDIAHQIEVLSLIRRLSRERGLSVIIVLHDINMAARFCDYIHALKQGRHVASGTPLELMQGPKLRDIYAVEMDVTRHPALNIPLAYVS